MSDVTDGKSAVPDIDITVLGNIKVLKGNPTDTELAAIVAVLASVGGDESAATNRSAQPAETWGHPTLQHRGSTAFSPSAFSVRPQLRS